MCKTDTKNEAKIIRVTNIGIAKSNNFRVITFSDRMEEVLYCSFCKEVIEGKAVKVGTAVMQIM